jgi:hypothetical protein
MGVGPRTTRSTVRLVAEAWEVAQTAAAALGVSRDAYLDAVLLRERDQLDEQGRPVWWTEDAPVSQEELPLKNA